MHACLNFYILKVQSRLAVLNIFLKTIYILLYINFIYSIHTTWICFGVHKYDHTHTFKLFELACLYNINIIHVYVYLRCPVVYPFTNVHALVHVHVQCTPPLVLAIM